MEKDCYQEIIDEVSKKLADKITSEEKNLDHRALSLRNWAECGGFNWDDT